MGHWLTHGPNNQIKDFRSGIYASIAMKRAVFPPLFYFGIEKKHLILTIINIYPGSVLIQTLGLTVNLKYFMFWT